MTAIIFIKDLHHQHVTDVQTPAIVGTSWIERTPTKPNTVTVLLTIHTIFIGGKIGHLGVTLPILVRPIEM